MVPLVNSAIGVTFTVTVIVSVAPIHEPTVAVGITRYLTVPTTELLESANTWFILFPAPAEAPVTPPVTAPLVQENVLAALAVNVILVDAPLQIATLFELVITGAGFTVIVIV